MSIFDKLKGAAKRALQEKLDLFQFLKILVPFDVSFGLAIRANVKTSDGKKHDFGIYLKPLEEMSFDIIDLQALVYQVVQEFLRKRTRFDWKLGRAMIGEHMYIAIYISRKRDNVK